MANNKISGILFILAASVVWAIEPILAKLSYQSGGDFLQTSMVRAFCVGAIGLLYAFFTNKRSVRVNRKEFGALVYLCFAATIFAELLYFYAFTKISVVNAVLIGHMQPVFIVVLGIFFLKEDKLHFWDYAGIAVMIFAGLMVTTKTPANLIGLKFGTMGDFYVVLSAFAWATASIVMRKFISRLNAGVITFYRYGIAFVIFFIVLAAQSKLQITSVYQIILGILVGVGVILYYEGLKRMQAALVGAVELSTPFFAAIMSYFILGEKVVMMQAAGIILMVFGIYLLSRKKSEIIVPV